MANTVTITITVGETERDVEIGSKQITLGYLCDLQEAQATGRWAPLMSAMRGLLQLTEQEIREMTLDQFNEISQIVNSAVVARTTIPNG